ncbi:hypothetical protein D3C71_1861440 [compost metagenome]
MATSRRSKEENNALPFSPHGVYMNQSVEVRSQSLPPLRGDIPETVLDISKPTPR